MAGRPGNPGSTQDGRDAGGHVRRLIALAEALTRSAAAASTAAIGGPGVAGADPGTFGPGVAGADPATPGPGVAGAGPGTFAASGSGHVAAPAAGPAAGPASGPGSGAAAPGACAPVDGRRLTAPLGMDMGSLSDAQAVSWAQELEHLGAFLAALQVQAAGDLAGRVRAGRFDGVKLPTDLFGTSLKLGRSEAGRRLRLAGKFLPATDELTLATTPAAQPVAAAPFFAGELSLERALTVSRYTEEARHLADGGRIPAQTASEVEETLTGYARAMDPDSLARVGLRVVNVLDPDGQQPTEGELLAKQGITFRQPRRGLVHFEGWATVPQYETWMAGIGSAANPRQHTDPGADPASGNGGTFESTRAGDDVMPGQMLLDGLLTPSEKPEVQDTQDTQDNQDNQDDQDTQDGCGGEGGENPGGAASPWPPAGQGPAPDWAQEPGSATGSATNADGSATNADGGATNADGGATNADGGATNADNETAAPWPHLVNGIQVPEPGSDEELPELDPIDPACTNPVVADRRTRAQKLLDGTIDGIKLAARTGRLPMNGGLKPQLFISTTETDLQRRTRCGQPGGIAFLPYSGPQPLALFTTELCDADVTTMILGNGQDILNVGRTQRLFTAAQRKILIARDKGCTFPHCRRTAMTTDAHHIVPWADGGETNISNAALLCTVHHHAVHDGSWSVELINGTPWFTPSYKIDPTRTKLRNPYHHGLPTTGS